MEERELAEQLAGRGRSGCRRLGDASPFSLSRSPPRAAPIVPHHAGAASPSRAARAASTPTWSCATHTPPQDRDLSSLSLFTLCPLLISLQSLLRSPLPPIFILYNALVVYNSYLFELSAWGSRKQAHIPSSETRREWLKTSQDTLVAGISGRSHLFLEDCSRRELRAVN